MEIFKYYIVIRIRCTNTHFIRKYFSGFKIILTFTLIMSLSLKKNVTNGSQTNKHLLNILKFLDCDFFFSKMDIYDYKSKLQKYL